MQKTLSVLLAAVASAACSTAPRDSEDRSDLRQDAHEALATARACDPALSAALDKARGIAVFPKVGKGAAGVGGAYGRGVLFEDGEIVGYCDLSQATVGLQLGGQTYTEIICFEDEQTLERFKDGTFTFDAQATAVALESGTGRNAEFTDGVCVFTMDEKGLMVEAAIGGQRFSHQPV